MGELFLQNLNVLNNVKLKNFYVVNKNLFRSGLLNGKQLFFIKYRYGLDTIIDLSDRYRKVIVNWCNKNNVVYNKIPVNEYNPNINDFIYGINIIRNKTLVHCYRGVHRTGAFIIIYKKLNNIEYKKDLDLYINICKKTHKELLSMVLNFIESSL